VSVSVKIPGCYYQLWEIRIHNFGKTSSSKKSLMESSYDLRFKEKQILTLQILMLRRHDSTFEMKCFVNTHTFIIFQSERMEQQVPDGKVYYRIHTKHMMMTPGATNQIRQLGNNFLFTHVFFTNSCRFRPAQIFL